MAQPELRYDDRHLGPDDVYWLIEVSNSTLTFDLEEKARLYARDGIVEYWVVDVPNRQLWVHRQPVSGTYAEKQTLHSGMVTPLAFPDLEIKVERLLPES